MNPRVVLWSKRGGQAAALGWLLYVLCDWQAPGALCLAGSGLHCAEASARALGKDSPDAAAAWRYAQRGCSRGDVTSCNNIGVCYQRGSGTPKSLEQASRQYRKACDLGSGLACSNYSDLPRQGALTPLTEQERFQAYVRGCELDYGPACWPAIGLSKDSAKALPLARRGCKNGDAPSCAFKAAWLATSQPQSEETRQSIVELTTQCSTDEPSACATLGLLYGAGAGVARDVVRARELLARSCRRGNQHACKTEKNEAVLAALPAHFPQIVERMSHRGLEVGP